MNLSGSMAKAVENVLGDYHGIGEGKVQMEVMSLMKQERGQQR